MLTSPPAAAAAAAAASLSSPTAPPPRRVGRNSAGTNTAAMGGHAAAVALGADGAATSSPREGAHAGHQVSGSEFALTGMWLCPSLTLSSSRCSVHSGERGAAPGGSEPPVSPPAASLEIALSARARTFREYQAEASPRLQSTQRHESLLLQSMSQSEQRGFCCAQGNGAVNASADKEGADEDARSYSSLHLPSSKGKEEDGKDSCGRHGMLNGKEVSGVILAGRWCRAVDPASGYLSLLLICRYRYRYRCRYRYRFRHRSTYRYRDSDRDRDTYISMS